MMVKSAINQVAHFPVHAHKNKPRVFQRSLPVKLMPVPTHVVAQPSVMMNSQLFQVVIIISNKFKDRVVIGIKS